jgi:hypothetical protein
MASLTGHWFVRNINRLLGHLAMYIRQPSDGFRGSCSGPVRAAEHDDQAEGQVAEPKRVPFPSVFGGRAGFTL